ncbi:alkyl hydroperoxide reductase subunit F [Salisediminibacterium selenitireducens]|uniref:NADH dehydrogenase n=1 Tax=Bacillus selenitireducens (strain ATCC 700615 / DSM 15326 / MLS10) TaxID=439292 RepID=D6XX71_BACIE|nr:alkyl hydroperoxide reductase subunit F [Salisediminibacterium selenitireducens]ADH97928.1 alkyl hydroperoxide reductase, F subunit [[Bacillus] selenitireducens MLS10]
MVLDNAITQQLKQYLDLLEGDLTFKLDAGSDANSDKLAGFVREVASMSPRITVEEASLARTPSFTVTRTGENTGVTFAGVPLGHEFTSFVLAILQVSGRPPKVEEETLNQMKQLEGDFTFETYVSLSCQNCPEVVQALNMLSAVNPGVTNTMIDGAAFKDEVEARDVMAVPAVYLNGEFLGGGRMTIEDILEKLGQGTDASELDAKDPFDVLVVGGGPAGASAAVYASRKGIRTGVVAERFGGQVQDTMSIENFISVKKTEGPKLVASLEEHVRDYSVDIMKSQRVKAVDKKDLFEVTLENGAVLKSKSVILSTGARWRNVGVPGEEAFKNNGVAYCPHCDGPLFEGKDVSVIGGGNSGVEAAIDLAGIVNHVYLLEFMPELKADEVLQKKLHSLPNVTVITNAQTTEITGDKKVNGISYKDRVTEEDRHIPLQGVFVQIGLVPNTEFLDDSIETTRMGEIVVDQHGATNVPGLFAAGDCTNTPYKQIIISMGSGATASLGAFDYLIRSEEPVVSV